MGTYGSTIYLSAAPGEGTMSTVYRCAASFNQEELGNELVVMEIEGQAVVTLNPTGRMGWNAIEDELTLDEIVALFRKAFPRVAVGVLRRDIQAVLEVLLIADLAVEEGEDG